MTEENKNDEILLSKEEVFDVIKFAQTMYNASYNLLTPDLLNQRIKEISFNPLSPTERNITDALGNAKNSEDQLRDYIEFFEILSMPLKRIFSYMASHLAFDLQYTVKNSMKDEEYESNKYIKDKEVLYEYFDKFDYRSFFRNISRQLLRNEMCVVTPRENKDTIVLQELPLQYCRITAKGSRAPLISFNFYYFIQPGVDINLYPDFFKKKYAELFGGKTNIQIYNPSLPPELRGNSEYNFWVDLPPSEGWVFKLDTSLMTAIPYFSAMLPLLINDQTMIALQKNINMASAAKILFGEVPMRKDDKGASVADMAALSPVQLGQFMALAKSAVGEAVKVSAAPLENMQAFSFEGDTDVLSKWIQTSMSMSGMDTALIYSMQTKANLVDSQLSFESDSKIMEQQLYPQFAAFLNYWVNLRTSKYKYRFRLEGNDYYLNRTQRYDRAMGMADKGIVLPQLISSAIGLLPQELERMLQEARGSGFVDKLTPIISGFQMSGKDTDQGGRPKSSDSELGEAGAQTRETGSNEAKKLK
jgi:hypothetical protein